MTRLYCGWDKDDKTLLWLKDATSTVIPDIIENNTRHFWKLKISYICDASYFRSSFSGPCKNFLRPCGCHPDLSRYSSINLIIPAMRNPLNWYIEWKKKERAFDFWELSTYMLQIDFWEAATSRSGKESSTLKLNHTYNSNTWGDHHKKWRSSHWIKSHKWNYGSTFSTSIQY